MDPLVSPKAKADPQDGEVSIDEFTTGLLTMKGPAKALDLKSIAARV